MSEQGTSTAYLVNRLKNEGRDDLVAAIETGRLSVFAAAEAAGYVQRPEVLGTGSPNQRRKRQHQLRALAGGALSGSQAFELWLGPAPTGSLFADREQLRMAWEQHRDAIMARWGSHGRRPAGFYEFDWDGHRPPYDLERSTLWRADKLTPEERVTLEAEWRAEFEAAQAPDFTLNDGSGELLVRDCARAAHYRWADIPDKLVKRWEKAERRRRERRPTPLREETAAT